MGGIHRSGQAASEPFLGSMHTGDTRTPGPGQNTEKESAGTPFLVNKTGP